VAVFSRALTAADAERLYGLSGFTPPAKPKPPPPRVEKPADPASLARYAQAVKQSKPIAYWRLHDAAAGRAEDASGSGRHGRYERRAAPHKPGSATANFSGGRMKADLEKLGDTYSVELWFYNTLPIRARPVTGYLFSRGEDGDRQAAGEHLGIGGTHSAAGRLIVFNGNRLNQVLSGTTALLPNSWHHVVMVRDQKRVAAYLNGDTEPEIQGRLAVTCEQDGGQVFVGGRSDNFANFVGSIDEVALYDRALIQKEAKTHFDAAGAALVR